jgi:hypothetical protein
MMKIYFTTEDTEDTEEGGAGKMNNAKYQT